MPVPGYFPRTPSPSPASGSRSYRLFRTLVPAPEEAMMNIASPSESSSSSPTPEQHDFVDSVSELHLSALHVDEDNRRSTRQASLGPSDSASYVTARDFNTVYAPPEDQDGEKHGLNASGIESMTLPGGITVNVTYGRHAASLKHSRVSDSDMDHVLGEENGDDNSSGDDISTSRPSPSPYKRARPSNKTQGGTRTAAAGRASGARRRLPDSSISTHMRGMTAANTLRIAQEAQRRRIMREAEEAHLGQLRDKAMAIELFDTSLRAAVVSLYRKAAADCPELAGLSRLYQELVQGLGDEGLMRELSAVGVWKARF
ncbi:hypothetical protein EJ05DRAFT_490497 [Pseudovirgaria hyperparasitica]|uniref:Uncharacterized protein n=1 Tax=Pseudovirgaria hyperparasitica TaxID=470096 RepID=A0A6A6VQT5_9PEZI|nr:uncharacterized protein EJ05DRAFT_490497 [Pseudovirgaria hyperparasitica]KAF2752962.1 hypothetical protein EJ05DRAFT_490497 [Pseudovirgaria hyperparasitica]